MGGKIKVELRTKITYGDMERLSYSSSSTAGGGEGYGSKGVDQWIVATGVNPGIPPIPGLDNPNVLSYVDVIRQDTNVGDMLDIIRARGIWSDVKRWMEDWGEEGTNKARAGAADVTPSQMQRGQHRKRQRGEGGRGVCVSS